MHPTCSFSRGTRACRARGHYNCSSTTVSAASNWWEGQRSTRAEGNEVRKDCREIEGGECERQFWKNELWSSAVELLCGLRCYAALMRPFLPVACDSVSSPPSPAAPRPPDTRLYSSQPCVGASPRSPERYNERRRQNKVVREKEERL